MNVHPMWDQYPDIKQDLKDMLNIIDANITLRDKKANKAIKNLLFSGGKLLRPAYFLMIAKTRADYNRDQILHVAASLEVLHLASLIHDDIIDEASTRRGVSTISNQFGTKYALYAGDYLFVVCFKILSNYAGSLSNIGVNTNTMERVLVGELEQMNSRYNYDITIKKYLSQISGKTAGLFSLSCFLGSQLNGSTDKENLNARRIGHYVGMAFQILDDILDYRGDALTIKKPALEDMKQGVYSLPLICAMNENRIAFLPHLSEKEKMTEANVSTVLSLVHRHGGIIKAQKLADKYTERALGRIKKLPESTAKEQLLNITKSLLKRVD